MHTIRAAAAAGLIALAPMGGCAQLENSWNAVTGAQVTIQTVSVAASSFDALEATATNYLRLPKCTGGNGPVCADPAVTAKLVPAVRAGRIARDNLEAFFQAHPDQLGPSGLYDALAASVATLQSAEAQFNMGAAK